MAFRDDLAALAARHATLEAELAAKTRELAAASALLEDARARTRLPVLDNIKVASPCTADWAAMTGDERVRHCGACDKPVFNLSAMTRDEAEALIVERAGKLCVRYFQRTDGTILLADCTVGVARKRRRRILAAGAAALLATGAALHLRGGDGDGAGGGRGPAAPYPLDFECAEPADAPAVAPPVEAAPNPPPEPAPAPAPLLEIKGGLG